MKTCECCGQPLADVRAGVRLSPLKTRIFDLIKARPGITKKELCDIVYDTVSQSRLYTIGSHIAQIRDKLESTDVTIYSLPYHGYSVGGQGVQARLRIGKRKVHVV
jgi:DNA-binding response OmpR family regulator